MSATSLSLFAVPDIPLIEPGDDLPGIIFAALERGGIEITETDIIVIAQKIVSKAEGRIVDLGTVTPGKEALRLAKLVDKDPRQLELILQESSEIIRFKAGVIVVEHHSGIIMANAGIDHSNVGSPAGREQVTLLPEDANVSAARIRRALETRCGKQIGVIINDSVGRAWRVGTVGIAIGCSGILPLQDLRGETDLFGEALRVSESADADALASAASLLMGEADDAAPVVIIRGHRLDKSEQDSSTLIRAREDDMFR